MKRYPTNLQRQYGTSLLEGLISIVLTTVIGMGLVFVCGRIAVAQRDMNANGLAVQQIRYNLETGCSNTASMTIASGSCSATIASNISASATTSSGTVSITNISIAKPTASATSSNIGGLITFTP